MIYLPMFLPLHPSDELLNIFKAVPSSGALTPSIVVISPSAQKAFPTPVSTKTLIDLSAETSVNSDISSTRMTKSSGRFNVMVAIFPSFSKSKVL